MRHTLSALLATILLLAGRGAAAEPAFELFPETDLYPPYVADPRRPEFGVSLLALPEPRIFDSGDRRIGLKLGGRFGLLRYRGVRLDIEAGFVGQFDRVADRSHASGRPADPRRGPLLAARRGLP